MLQTVYDYIKNKFLDFNGTLNFNPGSFINTVVLYISDALAVVWYKAVDLMEQSFIHTARGEYLRRIALDYFITYQYGSGAECTVVFGRTTAAPATIVIPAGTIVSTQRNFGMGIEFKTLEQVSLLIGETEVEAEVQAIDVGAYTNVYAGSILYIVNPIEGVETVVQEEDATGGIDPDSDALVRERILLYTRNFGRATKGALEYFVGTFPGVFIADVQENPLGEVTENSDSPYTDYSVGWTEEEDDDCYMGNAMESSTALAYVNLTIKGNYCKLYFMESDGICNVYKNGTFVDAVNTLNAQDLTVETTQGGDDIVTIEVKDGTIIFDKFIVNSLANRDAFVEIFVDNGYGTISWSTLNDIIETMDQYWRACGIRVVFRKASVKYIDVTLNVQWNQFATKLIAKSEIEQKIISYLGSIKPGHQIYGCNLAALALMHEVNGIKQLLCATIDETTVNQTLGRHEVARLGVLVFNEVH
jgi:uncharacterized phage protein gp47/JayE